MSETRIIISGGGTGGHIFPALSIAQSIQKIMPEAKFLFVGAEGRMEMQRVPAAGFEIKGLPVAGLQRSLTAENLKLPFKVIKSVEMARSILREFKPDVAVGVGGYASAPMLWAASHMGIPTLIQEQNSFAGLTNRILGRRARKICVAYEGMEKFFPASRILLTGNPVRDNIARPTEAQREEGYAHFGLEAGRKTILVTGGSLGSATLNASVRRWAKERAAEAGCQVLWQCGKNYFAKLASPEEATGGAANVHLVPFIDRMDLAFAVADVIISRAGAGTISELCIVGKPVIFVPSPNVTEDHQTHNARALADKDAALMISDAEAPEKVMAMAEELLADEARCEQMTANILPLARPDAGYVIAREVLKLINK